MDANVPEKVQEAIFNQLLDKPENKMCADCPNKSPTWASIDFGVFICLRCSGAHRRLSPIVTRVRSAKIDSWTMDQIEILAAVGNKIGNDYWENNVPSYYKKPDISTSLEEVFEFVKIKYVKATYSPKDRMNPVKEFLEAKKDGQTTAGSFNKAKMEQSGENPTTVKKNSVNVTKNPKTTESKIVGSVSSKNLMDFDEHEFKSAPVQTTKLDIPKPDAEVKFASNNGFAQKATTIDLLDFNAETKNSGTNLQKAKSVDPFNFNQSQGGTGPLNQKSNSSPFDSNKLYDLYKTGNPEQNQTKTVSNSSNFSGGQSNYSYLDMLGNQGQQNRFVQQQQPFGFQNNAGTTGMNNTQPFGGSQAKTGSFETRTVTNKSSGGFDSGTSNNSFSTGGGFGGSFNTGGYGTNSGTGFNITGNGYNSGGFNAKPNGNSFGTNQQQQPFSFNQTTTTTTPSFSFNTPSSTNNVNQSKSVNTGFDFF